MTRKSFGACTYCHRELASARSGSRVAVTSDHVMPKCVGGTRKVRCCLQCNQLKGDLHPSVWFWFTGAYPGWWRTFSSNAEVVEACRPHWGSAVRVGATGRARRDEMRPAGQQLLVTGAGE